VLLPCINPYEVVVANMSGGLLSTCHFEHVVNNSSFPIMWNPPLIHVINSSVRSTESFRVCLWNSRFLFECLCLALLDLAEGICTGAGLGKFRMSPYSAVGAWKAWDICGLALHYMQVRQRFKFVRKEAQWSSWPKAHKQKQMNALACGKAVGRTLQALRALYFLMPQRPYFHMYD
jgi:hypothetical protein